VPDTLDTAVLLEMHRRMLRIRQFELAAKAAHATGELLGALHLSIGQEAAIVGACTAVRRDDGMTGTHRSHGHPIGKGAATAPLMAELFGKATGVCKGKGGSMHLADFSVGSLGESGIVASGLPVAAGAGLSARLRGTDQVVLAFFGDGAANEGACHEALNLAAIWTLPVIFLCENNQYAVTGAIAEFAKVSDLALRAAGYGMPGVVVDGQDVLAVHAAVAAAAARARGGDGPSLVEAKTYRFLPHSQGTRNETRPQAEVAEWSARDPIAIHAARLAEAGVSAAELEALTDEVTDEIEAALAFARSSPDPDPADAWADLYAMPWGAHR
jgi:acetoin:2,6-dichlorophenolindophenol oxidoreductase subunit alpha